jgi:NAD(P)H-dependent flavin oxidoreductase YrpB (nitropropane dioxygenase family)
VSTDLRDRLSLEHPVVQAGMGGGIAKAGLAAAVSGAGGLGTIGILPPKVLAAEIRRARELAPGRPLAVNLLLPFTRRAHVDVCIEAGVDAVVLFFGRSARHVGRLRAAGILVIHQVGTATEAREALADGADALMAQGVEAGGHLRGVRPLDETLQEVLGVADGRPVLAAGGIGDGARAREVLGAGAAAVVAGTRFLLTEECEAHPAYQQRVLGAQRTLDTKLFGFGWPARHRVVPNAATDRWCARADAGAPAILALNGPTGPVGGRLPLGMLETLARIQRPGVPLLSPGPALRGMPDRVVEATPLYAGVVARDITQIVPAADAVRALAGA